MSDEQGIGTQMSRKRYCHVCGGELPELAVAVSAALGAHSGQATVQHYDKDICIGHLRKRVRALELEAMGLQQPGSLVLNREEALTLMACMVAFFSRVGTTFGKGPAILLGLVGKRVGLQQFQTARTLGDDLTIELLDKWYQRERARDNSSIVITDTEGDTSISSEEALDGAND